MEQPYRATADIDVLPMCFPIPGFSSLPINAFVIKGQEPVLIDTGSPLDGEGADATEGFMDALRQVIDPSDLKWMALMLLSPVKRAIQRAGGGDRAGGPRSA